MICWYTKMDYAGKFQNLLFPEFQGVISIHKCITKPGLQPRKLSFMLMSPMVPFRPSALPNNQGLPIIRTLGARMLGGQFHVFSRPCVSLQQAGSQTLPLLPPGTFATLADWLSLALLQNPVHLDGIVHRREGTVPCRAEISAQGTSGRQGLREMASWCR